MIILSQQQIAQIRKPTRSNHANSEHLLKVFIHIYTYTSCINMQQVILNI